MICMAAKHGQGGVALLLDMETSMRVINVVVQSDR